MDPTAIFFKIRAIIFASTMIISLVWTTLLCVNASVRYEVSASTERTLVFILILVNAVTAVLLPALLIVAFRAWLDGARLLFLLICHIGSAGVFTAWYTSYTCPDPSPNEESSCEMINVAIVICSWIIPLILMAYAGFLGAMYMLHFRHLDSERRRSADLPMMLPPTDEQEKHTSATPSFMAQVGGMSHPSWQPPNRKDLESDGQQRVSLTREVSPGSQSSGRLTKRLPEWHFS